MPSLDLYLHDQYVGVVTPVKGDPTRVCLTVAPGYRENVVLSESFATLPGRQPPIEAVSNFLGGYVPEGNHRQVMAAKRRIDPDNLFALLREFGGSIAGAVTLREPDELPQYQPTYEPLSEHQLANRLQQAVTDSDQGLPTDSRSTLPGYQPKVLVARLEGQWVYPHGRAHSTHILKPQVPARPTRIIDEHYTHLLSRHLDLSSYDSQILTANHVSYLAIERFDRTFLQGQVNPVHQEDLAQAMNLDWHHSEVKFQEPDWPDDPKRATARRIAGVLGSLPGRAQAVEKWLQHLTFHIAIGNNDAHAKNVAVLHNNDGTHVAPLYDAVPNLFQSGLIKWDLALAIDGIFNHRQFCVDNLLAEAQSWRVLSDSRASNLIAHTLTGLAEALTRIAAPTGISPGMVDRLGWNVQRLLAGQQIGEPQSPLGQ